MTALYYDVAGDEDCPDKAFMSDISVSFWQCIT